MKPNIVVKEIMKLRGYSNATLAAKLGKSTASAISNPLSRENGMRIDTFIEMVEAMDCEIIVRSILKDKYERKIDNKALDIDALLSDSAPQAEKQPHKIKLK